MGGQGKTETWSEAEQKQRTTGPKTRRKKKGVLYYFFVPCSFRVFFAHHAETDTRIQTELVPESAPESVPGLGAAVSSPPPRGSLPPS